MGNWGPRGPVWAESSDGNRSPEVGDECAGGHCCRLWRSLFHAEAKACVLQSQSEQRCVIVSSDCD